MAGEERTAARFVSLFQALAQAPHEFDFFQALRKLESLFREKPRIGTSLRPADDAIRIGQEPSLAFAPATLASFDLGEGGRPPRLKQFFLGVFGPNGPLPLHLTEFARDRERNAADKTLARFADMFHHRLLALFYRAWASAQPTVNFDRPEEDRFAFYLGSTFGLGMPALRERDALPDLAKLYFAGLLSGQTRHSTGLSAMLAEYFGVPVRVEEFVGHWVELAEDSMTRLGSSPATGLLGINAVIGEKVWDCQHKFRITVGPVGYADYQRLLPGGDSLRKLVALVRNVIDDGLSWNLKLILKKEEVPPLVLGKAGQLGWTTWAKTKPLACDADDLELDAVAYVRP
ncbi:MAG: type VI secretion system baseplate subunit TssG [Gammaproteobacteria bacterium]